MDSFSKEIQQPQKLNKPGDPSKNSEARKSIPIPNLRDPEAFENWVDTYINKPFKSFDEKHAGGIPWSEEEQLAATRQQIIDMVSGENVKGKPLADTLKMLLNFASIPDPAK